MKGLLIFVMCSLFTCAFNGTISAEPQDEVQITILYDNYAVQEGLETDWGFACLIEGTEKKILFDTGTNGDLFFRNAEALNADLEGIELVVISHDHGDHTGGLIPFLNRNSGVTVYLLTSFRDQLFQNVKQTGAKVIPVKEPVQICDGVHTTGEMGIQIKEQALLIDTDQGIVLITGCAHPGIVRIVRRAKEILGKEIFFVFGGFHLMEASAGQLKEIFAAFRNLGVKQVGATHCTGDMAIQMFKDEFGEKFVEMGVGKKIKIDF